MRVFSFLCGSQAILWPFYESYWNRLTSSFYELFASLGSPIPGRGIDFEPFWSETRGVLPLMAYTPKLRPKWYIQFRLQERYVRTFGLQAATTSNKGLTRFIQSLHFSFLPNKTRSWSRPSDNEGGAGGEGGLSDSEITGGPGLIKNFFGPWGLFLV